MKTLDENNIIKRFGYSTFNKGKEYYNENRVITALIDGDLLQGLVVGTRVYRVTVSLSDLSNRCSCPLGGDCKHVVALLLFYLNDNDSVIDTIKLKAELRERSKEELINIIIKALEGEEILPLIQQEEKNIRIKSFLRVFESGHVDEGVVNDMANVIEKFKNNISKEDLLMLLEKITLDCESFGCFYDDYGDYYYNEPIFKAIGEALVEKDLTQEDVRKLGEIIKQDEYELTSPLIEVLTKKAEADKKFFKLIEHILPPPYRAEIIIKNKMYDEAKKTLEEEDLDYSIRVKLLLLIDPKEALKYSEEMKKYHMIIQYYIERKDYDKAKMYIKRAIDENLPNEIYQIIWSYRDIILQDRELSNKIVRYLINEGNILDASLFYTNIDDDLKDLLAEKIVESDHGHSDLLHIVCERKPEKLKDYVLRSAESIIERGSREYDTVIYLLAEAKKCMSKEDFNKLIDEIEIRHYKKYKLIEKLSKIRD